MRERHGMSLEHELLELEKRFWTGDTEFYRRHLNDECLVAFTQMAGVMSKDAIAATVRLETRFSSADADEQPVKLSTEPHSPRWRSRAERRHW